MIFRVRFVVAGKHVHSRVFASRDGKQFTSLGSLTFNDEEWQAFRMAHENWDEPFRWEFVEEER